MSGLGEALIQGLGRSVTTPLHNAAEDDNVVEMVARKIAEADDLDFDAFDRKERARALRLTRTALKSFVELAEQAVRMRTHATVAQLQAEAVQRRAGSGG